MTDVNLIAEKLTQPLQVKTDKLQIVLLGILGIIFIPLGFGLMFNSIKRGFAPVLLGLGIMSLVCFISVLWIVVRAYLKSAKSFDNQGAARNDGRRFEWTDLERVVYQYRPSRYQPSGKALWRTEVQFQSGTIWLIPIKVTNFAEINQFVMSLPCDHLEKRV